jgi:competence protein ComEA
MLAFGLYRGTLTAPIAEWTPVNGPLIEAMDKIADRKKEATLPSKSKGSAISSIEKPEALATTPEKQSTPTKSPALESKSNSETSKATTASPDPSSVPDPAEAVQESPPISDPKDEGLLDLNQATKEELETLPGIGSSKAAAILEYRERQQGFRDAEQLLEIKGIGPKILERIIPLVRLSERK